MDKILHITNGEALTNRLEALNINEPIITWHEMLCEGPTIEQINHPDFIKNRTHFFKTFYDLDYTDSPCIEELERFNNIKDVEEIVLWFEYDLFCHINLIAVISLLQQKEIHSKISLVCSGWIPHEKELKGLSELDDKQLTEHYENRIILNDEDILLAQKMWHIYNSDDHNKFLPYLTKPSNFIYLTNCLEAHLRRFPDTRSGLTTLEFNILILIKKNHIKDINHLVGYTLFYQGYYGFSDIQMKRIINEISSLFDVTDDGIKLNRDGELVINHQKNMHQEKQNGMIYGGANKFCYVFNKKEQRLIKTTFDDTNSFGTYS